MPRKLKKIIFLFLCSATALSLNVSVFAHGAFLTVGKEITVQAGWEYIFLGHDGSAITGAAPVRCMFLVNPNGTEIPMAYAMFPSVPGQG